MWLRGTKERSPDKQLAYNLRVAVDAYNKAVEAAVKAGLDVSIRAKNRENGRITYIGTARLDDPSVTRHTMERF